MSLRDLSLDGGGGSLGIILLPLADLLLMPPHHRYSLNRTGSRYAREGIEAVYTAQPLGNRAEWRWVENVWGKAKERYSTYSLRFCGWPAPHFPCLLSYSWGKNQQEWAEKPAQEIIFITERQIEWSQPGYSWIFGLCMPLWESLLVFSTTPTEKGALSCDNI